MRIAVCIKTVVDAQSRIELDADDKLQGAHLCYDVNEYDLYSVEEALRLSEQAAQRLPDSDSDGEGSQSAEITLITLGDGAQPAVVQGLRKGLAMGADSAIHIDCAGDSVDAAGTAALLGAALREHAPDLVLAGVESDDLAGAQVGGLLAEELGYSCATLVVGTELSSADTGESGDRMGPGSLRVRRELEGGAYALVDLRLPAVLTIQTGINEPRYPSLKGIMAAKRKELNTLTPAELGFEQLPAPRVETLSLQPPPPRERARLVEGSAEQAAVELVRILRQEEKVL